MDRERERERERTFGSVNIVGDVQRSLDVALDEILFHSFSDKPTINVRQRSQTVEEKGN